MRRWAFGLLYITGTGFVVVVVTVLTSTLIIIIIIRLTGACDQPNVVCNSSTTWHLCDIASRLQRDKAKTHQVVTVHLWLLLSFFLLFVVDGSAVVFFYCSLVVEVSAVALIPALNPSFAPSHCFVLRCVSPLTALRLQAHTEGANSPRSYDRLSSDYWQ